MKVLITNVSMSLGGGTDLVGLMMARTLIREGFDVELRTVEPTDWEAVRRMFPDQQPLPEVPLSPAASSHSSAGTARWVGRASRYAWLLLRLWRNRRQEIIVNANGDVVPGPAHITYVYFPVAAAKRWKDAGPLRPGPATSALAIGLQISNVALLRSEKPLILAVSGFTRKVLREALGVDSQILYPPARLFHPGIGGDPRLPSVITVASFRTRKKLQRVLDVAAQTPEAKFVVIGSSGPNGRHLLEGLQRRAAAMELSDRVSFMMDARREELERHYWRSNVYFHPTPEEHFGMSAVEAMIAGCVPVVPRSGGQWEDVLDGRDGVWGFGYDSIAEAAETIRRLASDPELWRRMSLQAQERSRLFSAEAFSRNFLRIFEGVAANDRKQQPGR